MAADVALADRQQRCFWKIGLEFGGLKRMISDLICLYVISDRQDCYR